MVSYNLYSILGVSKDCSKDELKKAYKQLAIKHHPDKGGDENKFKEISEAYQVLNDDEKRELYNRVGDEGLQQGLSNNTVDPHDIFAQFFGNRGNNGFPFGDIFGMNRQQGRGTQRKKCRNLHHVIQITNKEAYFGLEKTIKIKLLKKCMKCISTCNMCQGSGQIHQMQRMGFITQMTTSTCNNCNGSGQAFKNNTSCNECNGKIDKSEEKIIKLEIQPGVETGNKIIIDGCGEQQQTPTDIPGDLIFEILVKLDNIFERKGLDLVYKSSILFKESIIGKKITIPLYDQELTIDISTFGITQPNKEYVIKNRGMKTKNSNGNLIIIFDIKYPEKTLDEDIKEEFKNILNKYL